MGLGCGDCNLDVTAFDGQISSANAGAPLVHTTSHIRIVGIGYNHGPFPDADQKR